MPAKGKKKTSSGAKRKVRGKNHGKARKASIRDHNLLSNALKDIERQLQLLKQQKLETEKQMRRLSQGISDTQSQEMALKVKVQKLVAKEEVLGITKQNVQEKIDKVKQKIMKITQLESEMEGLD